jgi:glycerol-3-phosphate responsive antiterminator
LEKEKNLLTLPGVEPRIIQHVANHHNDAIRAPNLMCKYSNIFSGNSMNS